MKKLFVIFILLISNIVLPCPVQSKTILPKLAPDKVIGQVGYYRWRYNDFMKRHPELNANNLQQIPDYYLDYGEKYATRFSNELYPKLSRKGQEWLVRARLNLQVMIEDKCKQNSRKFAELEERPSAFRSFAFETHPKAYMDAGLSKLSLIDLIKIGLTPDLKDLLSKNGSLQIISISGELGKSYLKQVFKFIRQTYKLICEAVQGGRYYEVSQAVELVEEMPASERKVVLFLTGSCRKLRQDIQFKLSHNEASPEWKLLLKRIKKLSVK